MSDSQGPSGKFTANDVRIMLSSPVYAYGINLLPADKVAEAVMQLNTELAQTMRQTGKRYTLDELDQEFQALLQALEASDGYTRGSDHPPLVPREMRLQSQLTTVEKLARGEKL
jgi:hypothetical protein